MTIKEQLKNVREEKGLSRKEVAEQAGIPYTTYVKYETGEREPVLSSLIKLADFYQTTLDHLVGRAPQTNPFAMLDLQIDIGEDAVMEQYMQLPKPWRQILLEVMKQLGDAAERGERPNADSDLILTQNAGELHDQLKAAADDEAEETAG